jgi:putative ABC transport system permease protein
MTLARKGRLFLTSLAIILGTGFLAGTFIFSDTLNSTFDRLFSDVFKDVDTEEDEVKEHDEKDFESTIMDEVDEALALLINV